MNIRVVGDCGWVELPCLNLSVNTNDEHPLVQLSLLVNCHIHYDLLSSVCHGAVLQLVVYGPAVFTTTAASST
jgi:hypothetical protein